MPGARLHGPVRHDQLPRGDRDALHRPVPQPLVRRDHRRRPARRARGHHPRRRARGARRLPHADRLRARARGRGGGHARHVQRGRAPPAARAPEDRARLRPARPAAPGGLPPRPRRRRHRVRRRLVADAGELRFANAARACVELLRPRPDITAVAATTDVLASASSPPAASAAACRRTSRSSASTTSRSPRR